MEAHHVSEHLEPYAVRAQRAVCGLLVGAIGFEPTTPCAQGRCATRLRYAPTLKDLQSVLNLY
jgi:hypothetical protein